MVSERCFNFTTVLLGWSHISKDLFAWRDYFLVQLLLCAPAHLLYRNENTHRELFNESVKISINSNRCIVNFHWQSLSHCIAALTVLFTICAHIDTDWNSIKEIYGEMKRFLVPNCGRSPAHAHRIHETVVSGRLSNAHLNLLKMCI